MAAPPIRRCTTCGETHAELRCPVCGEVAAEEPEFTFGRPPLIRMFVVLLLSAAGIYFVYYVVF